MRTHPILFGLVVFLALLAAAAARGEVVLETRELRLVLGENGELRGLIAKSMGADYAWSKDRAPAFSVTQAGKTLAASSAALAGDILTVRFGGSRVTAKLRVIRTEIYIALRLASLEGEPLDAINLLQLRLMPMPYLGSWINVAYDDKFGICLCGGNVKTNAAMSAATRAKGYVELAAVAYKDPGFEGATAVLFGCTDPKAMFLDAMAVVERDFNMPPGAKNRRSPVQRYSYLWPSPTPQDIDEYIRWAKRGGFRMILFSYTAFTNGVGHFRWNSKYPNGMDDLKKVTDAIRRAGLAVGLHIHYNKAVKTDAYVTPVPDDRLGKVRRFTLASAIDGKTDAIAVNENPKGCTLDEGRRILKVGKELVSYGRYTSEPPYIFLDCKRGDLKTSASRHGAGDEIALLDVDTWPAFIRFDQTSDIQDETARRIANIVEQTGPYDMVYFDGAEDVPAPFWYHCANAQWRVFQLLRPTPPVCEAAANTHFSWHMITRSNAYDSVAPSEMKEFCRRRPCKDAPQRALNFSRLDFGWLHGFGRSRNDSITPDTLEYILSRGAAWDCPFSMSFRLAEVKNNPRTESCFDVIRIWEDARIEQKLTDAQRKQLKNLDQEHHLFVNEKGEYELAAIREAAQPAGEKSLRAYTFRRESEPRNTYVLAWATGNDVEMTLPAPPERLAMMRPFGKKIPVQSKEGKAAIAVGERLYLLFRDTDLGGVEQVLRQAVLSVEKPKVNK